jgi:uncharacterized protein YutE (UPF0331/DUF86 family)
MTPHNSANTAYIRAQVEHLDRCEENLDDLRDLLAQREWTSFEEAAVERYLQILIESCIGVAKHWAKKESGYVYSEARQAFATLADRGLIESRTPWSGVIGLRNVLVHDYLEVDPEIVQDVVSNAYYRDLLAFGRKALKALAD